MICHTTENYGRMIHSYPRNKTISIRHNEDGVILKVNIEPNFNCPPPRKGCDAFGLKIPRRISLSPQPRILKDVKVLDCEVHGGSRQSFKMRIRIDKIH